MAEIQISTSVPIEVAQSIERMAKENLVTKAAIVRQILAREVRRSSESGGLVFSKSDQEADQ